jgi:starch phosphorylase
VAAIHSELLKKTLFKDFVAMRPKKFVNKTNGVTTRRWLRSCNKELSAFYDKLLGTDTWTLNMDLLK